jgi:hypothetical protein
LSQLPPVFPPDLDTENFFIYISFHFDINLQDCLELNYLESILEGELDWKEKGRELLFSLNQLKSWIEGHDQFLNYCFGPDAADWILSGCYREKLLRNVHILQANYISKLDFDLIFDNVRLQLEQFNDYSH